MAYTLKQLRMMIFFLFKTRIQIYKIKPIFLILLGIFLHQEVSEASQFLSCEKTFNNRKTTYSAGYLKYQPIEWLPASRGLVRENTFIKHDLDTGQQMEIVINSIPIEEYRKKLSALPPRVLNSGEYNYRILNLNADGSLRIENFQSVAYKLWQTVDADALQIAPPPPYYHSTPNPGAKLFGFIPPRIGVPEYAKAPKENHQVSSPTSLSYRDYPEVTLSGFVAESQFGQAQMKDVQLFPTNIGDESVGLMRKQKYKLANSTVEIMDVMGAQLQSTYDMGPIYPGTFQFMKKYLPNDLSKDLHRILIGITNGTLYQGGKVLERLLVTSGTDEIYASLQNRLLTKGNKEKKAFLKEILDFIIPLYRERRGWNEDKIQDFIANAYKTLDSTRYIVIRDRKGKIRAALGLTLVEYGKVRFFDLNSNSIVELVGIYGTAQNTRHYPERRLQDRMPIPVNWHSPVELLPAETEGFQIPHLGVLDHLDLSQKEINRRLQPFLRTLELTGWRVDTTKPIQFFSGRKGEPVKFGVDKNLEDYGLSNVDVLTQMLNSVFPTELNRDFQLNGQFLATYNTPEGVRMYRRLGFQKVENSKQIEKDGTTWILLLASPQSVVEAISQIKYMKSDEAEEILRVLQMTIGNGPN